MLLTSSQISLAISSSVVFAFTTLLFLSGYVLQQQTVHSLQAALNPAIQPPQIPTINPVLAKHFGKPPGHSFYDKFLAGNRPKGGWAKVAYVQLIREHVEVCGAVMLFSELEGQESLGQRIVLYPREWDVMSAESKAPKREKRRKQDSHAETSRRLLRRAAKQYKVMLQPIDPIPQPTSAGTGWLSSEEKYPLTHLLSLFHYNRILYLPASGLLLDATPLDLLFTLPMSTPMLGLSAPGSQTSHPTILLLQPSKQLFVDIVSSLPEGAYPDSEFLSRVTLETAPTDPDFHTRLLVETGSLDTAEVAGKVLNASEFMDTTAYVRLADEGLPGPEYDIPRRDLVRAMPGGKESGRAWEVIYERFRERRMGVCGLDLEPVEKEKQLTGKGEADGGGDGGDGELR